MVDEAGEILVSRDDVTLEVGSNTSIFLTGDDSTVDSYYIGVIPRQPAN